jgi:hypothetical protein
VIVGYYFGRSEDPLPKDEHKPKEG